MSERYLTCALMTEGRSDELSLAGSPGFSVGPPLTVELRTIAETASVRAEIGLLLVGLVPRCETESWTLCDPEAFRTVKGVDLALLPARPKDVERVPDPKKLLREVLGGADAMPVLGRLGRDVRLDRLQQIPAYRAWLAEFTRALKELHFL